MLRFILIFCFALAVSGSALYMTKLSVDGRYDRLSALQAEITGAKNRAIILEAEWAYLSRPDRLPDLLFPAFDAPDNANRIAAGIHSAARPEEEMKEATCAIIGL